MGKMIMNGISYGINANSTIYGAFIDTTNVLKPRTTYAGSFSYTATQDCAVVVEVANATSNSGSIFIDGASVGGIYGGNSVNQLTDTYYIKRGQTISGTTSVSGAEVSYTVYGLLYNAGETTNTIIPNPQAVPRDTLDSISIGGMVYDVGSKYGAFIDTNRIIQPVVTVQGSTPVEYTATEDCGVVYTVTESGSNQSMVYINDVMVKLDTGKTDVDWLYLRKGDSLRITGNSAKNYTVLGLIQGTNNIFTPQIYSLTEREVGTWIDNKPLYCKTIEIPSFPSSTAAMNKPHNISNIDTIAHYEAHARWASGAVSVIPDAQVNNGSFVAGASFDCTVNKTDITIRTGMDRSSLSGEITIWYTKTTDTAGSGSYNTLGVPMTHIEDNVETVIGTYNGKPLYQMKTSFTVNTTQQLNGFYRGDADLSSIMPTDIDRVLETSSNMQNPNSASRGFITSWYESDGQSLFYLCLFSVSGNIGHTTIKYTKITD